MPRRGNATVPIGTEWIMEVFPWPTDWPSPMGVAFVPNTGASLQALATNGVGVTTGQATVPTATGVAGVLGLGNTPPTPNVPSQPAALNPPNKFLYANKSVITSYSGLKITKELDIEAVGQSDLSALTSTDPNTEDAPMSIGLKALSIRRSKDRVDSQATAVVVGPLPKHTRQGNWVIISSMRYVVNNGATTVEILPRFIGQIHSISSRYMVQASGNITEVSNLQIREWSGFLLAPVKYDLRSFAEDYNSQANFQAAAGVVVGNVPGANPDPDKRASEMQRIASTPFNPYTMAETFLYLVGGLNAIQSPLPDGAVKPDQFTIGITMPSVPVTVLKRLHYDTSKVKPENAFQKGFALMVSGRQQKGVRNNEDWNGIFSSIEGEYTNPSVMDKFVGKIESQPLGLSTGMLSQLGKTSVWSLISNYCDPSMNEAYTDILYENPQLGDFLTFRPAIFVRGKPYRTKAAEALMKDAGIELPSDAQAMYNTWTKFEDLPRIRIFDGLILNAEFSSTIMTSPNYVYSDYQVTDGLTTDIAKQQWGTLFRKKLYEEMKRFGGNATAIKSQFYYTNGKDAQWAQTRIALGVAWYSYLYRMASGTLNLKGGSIPLTVGFNIQFKFGGYELVAQIDAINVNFSIDEEGNRQTTTSISFSRCMMVDKDKKLQFLPDGFGDLFKAGA